MLPNCFGALLECHTLPCQSLPSSTSILDDKTVVTNLSIHPSLRIKNLHLLFGTIQLTKLAIQI